MIPGKPAVPAGRSPMNSLLQLRRIGSRTAPMDAARAHRGGAFHVRIGRPAAAGRGADGVVACELPRPAGEPGLDDPDLLVGVGDGHIDTPPQRGFGRSGEPELIESGQLGTVPDQQLPIGGLRGRA